MGYFMGCRLSVSCNVLKTTKAKVNPGSNDVYVTIPPTDSIPYLVVEVGILRVMQDRGAGCCGEDWTSWLAIDALEKQQKKKRGKIKIMLGYFLMIVKSLTGGNKFI